jgi:hypothetical protein
MSVSGSGSGGGFISRASEMGTVGQIFVAAFGGIILSGATGLIRIQQGVVDFFGTITGTFATGAADWIQAFTSDPANFLGGSFEFAIQALTSGPWANLGPFAPWVAVIVSLGVVFAITEYLDRRDSDVPGTGLDLPWIGNDADGEED